MAEKVLPHEGVVARGMLRGEAHVFVEVEGRNLAEVEALLLVQAHEFPIHEERGVAGGQAEHGVGLFADEAGDVARAAITEASSALGWMMISTG